ncbi:response regulator [Undibacterium sp.]|uniref:response regulator n=1 Tax=Undibacterium sp. TaxID=1914977 RepID=UPI00374D9066
MHFDHNDAGIGQPDANSSEDAAGTGLRILVVEDNLNLKDMLCDMLELLGQLPQGAGDAEQALVLAQQPFDVLLTDVSLPGMSGIELAKQLLVKQPDIQVVFASGYGAQMVQHLKFKSRVLPKPYDVVQIQQLLADLSKIT